MEKLIKFIEAVVGTTIYMQFPVVVGLIFLTYKSYVIFDSKGSLYVSWGWFFNFWYLSVSTIEGKSLTHFDTTPIAIFVDVLTSLFFLFGASYALDLKWINRKNLFWIYTLLSIVVCLVSVKSHFNHDRLFALVIFDIAALASLSFFFFKEIDSLKVNLIFYGALLYTIIQLISLIGFNHLYGFFFGLFSKSLILLGFHFVFLTRAADRVDLDRVNIMLRQIFGSTFHELAKPMNKLEEDLIFLNKNRSKLGKDNFGIQNLISAENAFNRLQAIFVSSIYIYQRDSKDDLDLKIYFNRNMVSNGLNYIAEQAYLTSRSHKENADKIEFSHDYVGNAYVVCNSSELIEAITNIINNSIDAVDDDGSGRIRISTKSVVLDSFRTKYLELRVEDNGHGIPEHLLSQITDMGVTTKVGDGHGYGLYYAKEYVSKNSGELFIESPHISLVNSDPTRGTLVKLRFKKFISS